MAGRSAAAKLPDTRVETIDRAHPSRLEGCTVVVAGVISRRGRVFIRTADGRVFTTGRSVNMATPHDANDAERRAWCRLSGVKFADLKLAMRAEREREAKRQRGRDLARAESLAKRLGLKLAKPRKVKG